jgi:hypothetical protein
MSKGVKIVGTPVLAACLLFALAQFVQAPPSAGAGGRPMIAAPHSGLIHHQPEEVSSAAASSLPRGVLKSTGVVPAVLSKPSGPFMPAHFCVWLFWAGRMHRQVEPSGPDH